MPPKYFLRLLISIVLIITILTGSIPFFGLQTIALANAHPDSPFSETTHWDNMAGNSFSGTTRTTNWEYTDLTIQSDPPMHFTRFYNSQDNHVGMLGRGWRHSYYIEVVEDTLGVKLVLPSGSEIDFFFDAAYMTPRAPHGWDIEVVSNSSGVILGYDITG
ncbi:MAG: DUF6531 domain-containing protein, partial [Defluviitaleaceae bacterium]|nr:DUF6531 domain-containing protein [Defluviitaleaceae bacterium]